MKRGSSWSFHHGLLAKKSGLNIKVHDGHGALWEAVWELYMRLNHVCGRHTSCKVVESADDLYSANVPPSVLAAMEKVDD